MTGQGDLLTVIHLDDDPFDLEHVGKVLAQGAPQAHFTVLPCRTVSEFRTKLNQQPKPDIVLLDVHLSVDGLTGVELAEECRRAHGDDIVLIMRSSADDPETISRCLRAGADDFLSKESDGGELCLRVVNSFRLAQLKRGRIPVSEPVEVPGSQPQVIGESMRRIAATIPRIVNSAVSAIHVHGESGTGKEVVVSLFEDAASKAQGLALSKPATSIPFIRVNCGAITPTLLESELFGHVKGAFTGAVSDRRGLIESASGGWIFLDEVASLSASAQVALLRVLENQEVMRVGSSHPIRVQVRVISATHENLGELSRSGRFRQDLWQRLHEAEIVLPPLRERAHEIPELAKAFAEKMAGGPYRIAQPALEVLTRASWRDGNVRQLRNVLRAMTIFHADRLLTPLSMPQSVWEDVGGKEEGVAPHSEASSHGRPPGDARVLSLPLPITSAYRFEPLAMQLLLELVRRVFADSGKQSVRSLARELGLPRSSLTEKLRDLVTEQKISMEDLSRMVNVTSGADGSSEGEGAS